MEDIIYTIYNGLPRLGPGDNAFTRKALYSLPPFDDHAHILDIGCGTGVQTMELARLVPGHILALDNHEDYLRQLMTNARKNDLDRKISVIKADMHNLPFSEAEFDLIWSEGAIYIIGFERGLVEWKKFLRPGGFLAVSELVWTGVEPPAELLDFWKSEYPDMKTLDKNFHFIDKSGFDLIRHFPLTEVAWWDNYYLPLRKRINILQEESEGDSNMSKILEMLQVEIDMYRKYNEYYNYIFFILKKPEL